MSNLDVTITNDADMERQAEVSFLVDTGAFRSWVPRSLADGLGIRKFGSVLLELATGRKARVPYGLWRHKWNIRENLSSSVFIRGILLQPLNVLFVPFEIIRVPASDLPSGYLLA